MFKIIIFSTLFFSSLITEATQSNPIEIKSHLDSEVSKDFSASIKKLFKEKYQISRIFLIKNGDEKLFIATLNFPRREGRYCNLISYKDLKIKVIYEEPYCKWKNSPTVGNKNYPPTISFPMEIKAYSDANPGDSIIEIKRNTNPLEISF